tara:strand:+ start:123352 stop:123699 length:348 start_codon:yes stop_codon:yes gene_type:complete
MTTLITLSEEQFEARFPLIRNHLNPTACWDSGDGYGCLFDNTGPELDFIQQADPLTVWTVVDGEDGDLYVLSGRHFVNRIGYLVSTTAIDAGVQFEVPVRMADDADVGRSSESNS